ncbi:MAG: hypothetical protein AAGF11_07610 [Myxococcota bacterium]
MMSRRIFSPSRQTPLGTILLAALADELSDWVDPVTDRDEARPPHGLLVE